MMFHGYLMTAYVKYLNYRFKLPVLPVEAWYQHNDLHFMTFVYMPDCKANVKVKKIKIISSN